MRKIIYISRACSRAYYSKIGNKNISHAAQKYNQLLAEGLVKNKCKVIMIANRPAFPDNCLFRHYRSFQESENGVEYHYLGIFDLPFIRELCLFMNTLFLINKNAKSSWILCDTLNLSSLIAACIAKKHRKKLLVGIVTDVPGFFANSEKLSLREKINLFFLGKCDGYLFLTEYMNTLINSKNKPSIVLEGHVDISSNIPISNDDSNNDDSNCSKKICMYAGSIRRIYGIEYLINGFLLADIPNTELHIYGDGDYKDEIVKICKLHSSIKYFGIRDNHEVVAAEKKSTLLVNPRPTKEEYTKYSFPSKNMEYMASGTPLLTTRLPGMPLDHYNYVFILEDESAEGIKEKLIDILSRSETDLREFGVKAQQFVLREKNNVTQAAKLVKFVNSYWNL